MDAIDDEICLDAYSELAKKFDNKEVRSSVYSRYANNTEINPCFIEFINISEGILGDDFEIDWSLPFSDFENLGDFKSLFCLSFAKDEAGNSFHIYDASRKDSPIILKSHDPAVLVVVADDFCEFVQSLKKFSNASSNGTLESWFENKLSNYIHEISNSSLDEWSSYDKLGLLTISKDNSIQVDFSNATKGAGISLSTFGELTSLRRNLKVKSINLMKPKEVDVKRHEREKFQTKAALIGVPTALFMIFTVHAILQSMPLMGAIVMVPLMSIISSIGVLFVYAILYPIFFNYFRNKS